MESTLISPAINTEAEAESYVERILGEIKSIRDQMKSDDVRIARFREETAHMKADFAQGATEGETRIREMNILLDRLFPPSNR